MNIPSGYTGTLHAFYRIHDNWGYLTWIPGGDAVAFADAEGYINLGASIDVDVKFTDPRAAVIADLERQIEKEKAASHQRVQLMLGKINELRALEHVA